LDRLKDRVAIVTGGGKGLGAVYAKALAAEGASVAIADVVDAAAVAAEIRAATPGARVLNQIADVSDESSVKALVEATVASFGHIDILVNNAALYATLPSANVTEIDTALWDQVMAVNVRGPFLMVKHVAPHMIARRSGKIINISSGVAYKGLARRVHYATSKGAMLSFTRSLARELGAHQICVNSLAPGLILSDSIAANPEHLDAYRQQVVQSRSIQRDGFPADLIGALVFLASSESDFVTGQTIVVDGGSVNA
jgi:NAD(P)-dependent dehydrogenase (short-subunit alcohol dehydrogenase family)